MMDADQTITAPLPSALPARCLAPAGLQWGAFRAIDGATLRWAHLPVTNPRCHAVLVGGFSEFAEKYFETMADLAARGIAVWFLEWRGQGSSVRPRRHPTRPRARKFNRDAADLATFVNTYLPQGRRVLIAHSMGGGIGMWALARRAGFVDAAVLSAPMLDIATGNIPPKIARILAAVVTAVGFGAAFAPGRGPWREDPQLSPVTSQTSHDPVRTMIQQAWFSARPALRLDGPTYSWVYAALGLADRLKSPARLRSIATPVLMGVAGEDFFVDQAAEKRAADLMPHCQLLMLPDARHELFFEIDAIRNRWLDAIDDFLSAQFPISRALTGS